VRAVRRSIAWAVVTLLLLTSGARADDAYHLEADRETALIAGGVGLLVTAHLLRDDDVPPAPPPPCQDPAALRWFDRGAATRWSRTAAHASDWLDLGLALSPYALAAFDDDAGTATALMHTESLLLTSGVVAVFKEAIGRARPYTYNDDPAIPDAERARRFATRSFPSGHAATAFASAMLLGEVYGELHPDDDARHWVRYGSLATAGVVSYLRYAAGVHFPSDLVVGAAIGAAIGWAVPALHESSGDDDGGGGSPAPGLVLGFGF
jgi:membrane-associated phospholipid phosphatase